MNLLVRSSNTTRKQNAIAAAIFCSLLLLVLPSCAIPKLHMAEPGAPLPGTYIGASTPDNSAQIGIDDFFNDPTLTMLISEALVGNQQLKILAEDINIANNEVRRRRGAFLPFITSGGGASLNKYSQYTLLGADNNQNTLPNGTNFSQSAARLHGLCRHLLADRHLAAVAECPRRGGAAAHFASIDGRTYAVTRLVADVAENYYTLMSLDKRLENLDTVIALQEQSLQIAIARKEAARGTELAVQRFQAEVRKNQSEKLIINQEMIEVGNRINFLLGRYPQPIPRASAAFLDLNLHTLSVGVPAELLQNRPDIRQKERELAAAGIDVRVARANFYPKLFLTGGVGYEAFNPKYLFLTPESLIYNAAADLTGPLINKSAIRAEYLNANARQLQAVYEYQRTILNAFTEVVNRVSKVQNYSRSIEIKRQQLASLESAVSAASNLFQNARVEYIDVLFAQRDLLDARQVLIQTKKEQLSAIVNAYQALGGGAGAMPTLFDSEGVEIAPDAMQPPQPPGLLKPEELPMPPNK